MSAPTIPLPSEIENMGTAELAAAAAAFGVNVSESSNEEIVDLLSTLSCIVHWDEGTLDSVLWDDAYDLYNALGISSLNVEEASDNDLILAIATHLDQNLPA